MLSKIRAIQKTHQHTAAILKKLMESGNFSSENDAFVLLRATMKALRDRIDPHEAMHLGGQLPILLRGFYFEGFDFSKMDQPHSFSHSASEFIEEVRTILKGHSHIDLPETVPLALKVILDSIDQGEAIQVLHCLPKEIQELCPE